MDTIIFSAVKSNGTIEESDIARLAPYYTETKTFPFKAIHFKTSNNEYYPTTWDVYTHAILKFDGNNIFFYWASNLGSKAYFTRIFKNGRYDTILLGSYS